MVLFWKIINELHFCFPRYKAKAEKNAKKAAVEIVPKEDELDEIFHTITQDELKQAG